MIEKLRRRVFFYVGEDEGVHLPTPVYESLLSVVETAEAAVEFDPGYADVNDPNPLAASLARLQEELG